MVLSAAVFLVAALPARGEGPLIISGETTWQGRVDLTDDVLVIEGGHLVLAPGTEVVVRTAQGTKTDPHFFSTETEITVRGKLTAEGTGAGITFRGEEDRPDAWAGIFVDGPRASAALRNVRIGNAGTGVTAIDAPVDLAGSTVSGCRYGVLLVGRASANLAGTRLTANTYGLADYTSGTDRLEATIAGNTERDVMDRAALSGYEPPPWWHLAYRRSAGKGEVEFLGEHSLAADATWEGRVVIRGQVVVQPGATLTILPGTEVAFRRLDTNADGLGESTLLVLGGIRVLGTAENWVLFTSAESDKRPGDWDKVSLIASEAPENLVRHARFEYGYQAFHNHFSSAVLERVIFADNFRGVQFQESPSTTVAGAWFTGNKSAMRFRDSGVTLSDILLEGNVSGINFLRCRASIRDTVITGSLLEPLLGRESETRLDGVLVIGNREGPRFKGDGSRLVMDRSAVHRNLEDGISMTDTRTEIADSLITANGLDGLSVTGGEVTVRDSSLAGNGRKALDNNGPTPVNAGRVWWGTTEPAAIASMIIDAADSPGLGSVATAPPLASPPGLLYAGTEPPAASWKGPLTLLGDVTWPAGRPLVFEPGAALGARPLTDVSPLDTFRDHPALPGAELAVKDSTVSCRGAAFAAADPKIPWGGLNLEKVSGLAIDGCDFSGADSALHLRESAGSVVNSLFHDNLVGLRFNTSKILVRGNTFRGNRYGLRFHLGSPDIRRNRFTGNRTAIFISRDPGSFTITENDFENNNEYDLALGEEVTVPVAAPMNWWGTTSEEEIARRIFDAVDDPVLGAVRFRPVATKPWLSDRP